MSWKHPSYSFVWIFPAGRGNCAFLRTALNHGFIIDMAEGMDGFDIPRFIAKWFVPDLELYPSNDSDGSKIAQTLLSHAHRDHIEECERLRSGPLHPYLLTCPNDKIQPPGWEDERFNWNRHGNPKGTEDLINIYRSLYHDRHAPLQSIRYEGKRPLRGMEYGLYYLRPPICDWMYAGRSQDNEYGNATSIMFYFRHGEQSILFPGDMTPEGMKRILEERNGSEKRFTRFYESAATV